jgi:hypothetical protein
LRSENVGAREVLFLELVNVSFEAFARDPVSMFRPYSPSSTGISENDMIVPDVLYCLFKHSVVQREIIACPNQSVKESFLQNIDSLLSKVQSLVPQVVSADGAEQFALRYMMGGGESGEGTEGTSGTENDTGGLNKKESDEGHGENESLIDEPDAEDERLAEAQALVFTAKLFGICCKSFETGGWDAGHACSLQSLLQSPKFRSRRPIGSLYQRLINLQRGIDRHILLRDDKSVELMTVDEGNRFMFAIQAVRSRVLESSLVRQVETRRACESSLRGRAPTSAALIEPSASRPPAAKLVSLSLPKICEIAAVRLVVATVEGWIDFEAQHDSRSMFMRELKTIGDDLLSRYDPSSTESPVWVRPKGRRNQYFTPETRELLDKRVLPVMCGCVFGRVQSRIDIGGNSLIACSNDSCTNRHLKIECSAKECRAGDSCQNQRMQRMQYAKMERVRVEGKGFGIVAGEDIPAGDFIGEYQGEVIDEVEMHRREQAYCGERHFYFMSLTSRLYIDASRVAQITRFINHSCDPNAETQKWNAGGEPRVGIFARSMIRKGEEITFDYGVKRVSVYEQVVKCLCGAAKCRGYLLEQRDTPETKSIFRTTETDDQPRPPCAGDVQRAQIAKGHRFIEFSRKFKGAEHVNDSDVLAKEEGLDAEAKHRIAAWRQSLYVLGGSPGANGFGALTELERPTSRMDEPNFRIPKIRISDDGALTVEKSPIAQGEAPPVKDPGRRKRTGSLFAPVRKEKDRKSGGNLAPVVRNRPAEAKSKENGDDSDSCDDLSIASPTVPVDDEDIFLPAFNLSGGACSDDEFVEAPPIPEDADHMDGYGRFEASHTEHHMHRMSPRSLDRNEERMIDPRLRGNTFRRLNGHSFYEMHSRDGVVQSSDSEFYARAKPGHKYAHRRPDDDHDTSPWPDTRGARDSSPPMRSLDGVRGETTSRIVVSSMDHSVRAAHLPRDVPRASAGLRQERLEPYPSRPDVHPARSPSSRLHVDRVEIVVDPRAKLSDPRSQANDPRSRTLQGEAATDDYAWPDDYKRADGSRNDAAQERGCRPTIFERLGHSGKEFAHEGREYSNVSSGTRGRFEAALAYKSRSRESVRSASPRRDGHEKYFRR